MLPQNGARRLYVYIFSVVPVYPEELKFKISNGVGELVEKFNEFDLEEIVNIDRKNTCKNLDKFS
ncbi:MAG: suppressor of fused domain protein [Saprospiraceae bacterium]|nr:suppressor of fused domain protein [Saprospiraceae bacterium]